MARASSARPPEPATSPAPPRAAVAAGASRLVIITEPDGASVTINGVGWGSTPVTVRYLPPGTKRIRVTRSGYRSEERVVNVNDGRSSSTLRIALREAPKSPGVR